MAQKFVFAACEGRIVSVRKTERAYQFAVIVKGFKAAYAAERLEAAGPVYAEKVSQEIAEVENWGALTWCSRADLAQKGLAKVQAGRVWREARIVAAVSCEKKPKVGAPAPSRAPEA